MFKKIIACGFMVALTAAFSAPAYGANPNEGTIKVYQESTCDGNDNDPKIDSPFYVGGAGFNPFSSYKVTFSELPSGPSYPDATQSGETNEAGAFCTEAISLLPGLYKVTYTDEDGNKFKVFKVVGKTAPPTTAPPTTSTPTTAPPTTSVPTTESPTTNEPDVTETPTFGTGGGSPDELPRTGLTTNLLLGSMALLAVGALLRFVL